MKILVLDFESRFTKDVENILIQHHVDYKLVKHDYLFVGEKDIGGIIVTGSHDSVYAGGRRCDSRFFRMHVPVLGICYGHQLINDDFLGKVTKAKVPEFEREVTLHIEKDNPIFKNIPNNNKVGMYHYDEVVELGEGFERLAYTDDCKYAASYNKEYGIYTLQFHPEDDKYSQYKDNYFTNFFDICGIEYK